MLANIHVVRMCQEDLPLEPITQNFFHQCLTAVSSSTGNYGSNQFKQSVTLYNGWCATDVIKASNKYISNGWQQNASRQMLTNATNTIKPNFYRRFHKHIKRQYDFDGREAYAMLKLILDLEYIGNDIQVLEWRARIPRKTDGYLDNQLHLLLPLTYTFLLDIEEWTRQHPTMWRFDLSVFFPSSEGLNIVISRCVKSVFERC